MPTNQPTILRFYGEHAGEIPHVSPFELSDVCREITQAYQSIIQVSGCPGSCQLVFATTPRRGCLELIFQPIFDITVVTPSPANLFQGVNGAPVVDIDDLVGLGMFLWVVVFGDRGMVDLFRRGGPQPADYDRGESINLDIAAKALTNSAVTLSIQMLLNNPNLHKWSKLTISVSDEEVTLYDNGERRVASILGRRHFSGASLKSIWDENEDLSIVRQEQEVVEGLYKGKKTYVFTASTNAVGQKAGAVRIIVIWTSEAPIPIYATQVMVRGRQIDRSELGDLISETPYPDSFEMADALFLVTSVRTYI